MSFFTEQDEKSSETPFDLALNIKRPASYFLAIPSPLNALLFIVGVVRTQATLYKGERWGASRGYLHPALTRLNLHVTVGAHVTKVRAATGQRSQGERIQQQKQKQQQQNLQILTLFSCCILC